MKSVSTRRITLYDKNLYEWVVMFLNDLLKPGTFS